MIRPIRRALMALSLALATTSGAHAASTYLLTLQGIDQRGYPPCRLVDQPPPCDTIVDRPWTGTLAIVIDSNADGVFAATDVQSFNFHTTLGTLDLPFAPGSVTVTDGRVTSVDFGGAYPDGTAAYMMLGLRAYYDENFDAGHEVTDHAVGTLTAVPEPGSLALTLSALMLAAAGLARSGRDARTAGR